MTTAQHMSTTRPDLQDCIRECTDCHGICVETVQYCLQAGGRHAAAEHIQLLLDCADICRTSADFMLRSSDRHGLTCGVCARICEACADECDGMGDDQVMARCAATCRSCAQACRQMAA